MGVDIARAHFDAAIFDLDGVVTDTATLHFRAWKGTFDDFLSHREEAPDVRPFTRADYLAYVDGRTREDGVATFLVSRHIDLPAGDADEPPGSQSRAALAASKTRRFLALLASEGPELYGSSVRLVDACHGAGIVVALVTSSRNCVAVVQRAGIVRLFDAVVDGNEIARLGIPGKPDPAPLVEAAHRLRADPARTVVIDDACSGMEAGRHGGFGLVIGVDRSGDGAALMAAGADAVVADLSEVEVT